MEDKFAIFGKPVEHSKSPQIHNAAFKKLKIQGKYIKHLVENGEEIGNIFLNNNYKGANITVPYKEVAFKNAHEVRGLANEIEAVNTYINENGKIIAYNTDALGFFYAIKSFTKVSRVLVLGAGGTAKAISLVLRQNNIDVTILNRGNRRLKFFKEHDIKAFSWEDFHFKTYDLIVNSTSAGLKDKSLPCNKELLKKLFKKANFAFDCVYGKVTPFLNLAQQMGLEIKDGEDMLLYQGVLAFELFTNTKADENLISVMKEALKKG